MGIQSSRPKESGVFSVFGAPAPLQSALYGLFLAKCSIFEPAIQRLMGNSILWLAKVALWAGRAKHMVTSALISCGLAACADADAPLDPKVRYQIDSLSAVEMQRTRMEVDSWCAQERVALLPVLMDSIRRQRLQQIERQLQALPQ